LTPDRLVAKVPKVFKLHSLSQESRSRTLRSCREWSVS
jgi:hypothetical protein